MSYRSNKSYLVVGLGNPGKQYENTRHNLGFLTVNKFIEKYNAEKINERIRAGFWRVWINGNDIVIMEPKTYMNESGTVVSPFLKTKNIPEEHLIVIHDDLDLPFSKIRVSKDSSAAGHKGVQSVIDAIGTKNFTRVRVGIGMPTNGQPIEEYVLTKFSAAEKNALPDIIDRSILEIEKIFQR